MSIQVQSLRDALDHVTKEKRGLEVLCRQLKLTVDTLKEKEGVRGGGRGEGGEGGGGRRGEGGEGRERGWREGVGGGEREGMRGRGWGEREGRGREREG